MHSRRPHLPLLLIFTFLGLPVPAGADQTDFRSLCHALLGSGGRAACDRLSGMFFKDPHTREFAPILPEQVQAPGMPVDSRIQFLVFNDPNYVSAISYCYFVYREWINPSRISPDQLGLSASGFAILNEDLADYQRWLERDRAGRQCKARVQSESGVTVANLEASMGDKIALIALNPLAAVRSKAGDFKGVIRDMALTINHERVHAYQVLCPRFARWSKAQWDALSSAGKKEFISKHPHYNWRDPQVTAREYAGFLLEGHPERLSKLVGSCAAGRP